MLHDARCVPGENASTAPRVFEPKIDTVNGQPSELNTRRQPSRRLDHVHCQLVSDHQGVVPRAAQNQLSWACVALALARWESKQEAILQGLGQRCILTELQPAAKTTTTMLSRCHPNRWTVGIECCASFHLKLGLQPMNLGPDESSPGQSAGSGLF